jgi:methanol--5-hydroxybenzimidazolylcobamide Co-methyltransferase
MPFTFSKLAVDRLDDFVFGRAPRPVALKNGLVIGGGDVLPEINFTLPPMAIEASTMPEVRDQYRRMISGVLKRAVDLHAPGLIVEFELLPDLTLVPEWGAEITILLKDALASAEAAHGLKTALRATPNDIREFVRPPFLRQGEYVDRMFRSFELSAAAGADFLAIESTGGKELHDDAILNADLGLSVFSLGILGARDMAFLWDRIVEIADRHGSIPSGDSACGFANTAMVLAEQGNIPRVWAALIRVMTVARSLVAFERGALGPGKDCAYEGVYTKAITGCPVSLEGAEAACAHLSPIGNAAKSVPDLWSNESVQNVMLLGGPAPTVSMEQLIYAVRLMNAATAAGPSEARLLRDWFALSDALLDPQAYVLKPDIALELAGEIVREPSAYLRTRRAALAGVACLRRAVDRGEIKLPRPELRWLDLLSGQAEELPVEEEEFIAQMRGRIDKDKVRLDEYGLK